MLLQKKRIRISSDSPDTLSPYNSELVIISNLRFG
ncbi:hypothetical protein PARMER_00208 [Parabacteroides merdae ATCC 43184]|nr:hypothetical protein PARMER_00208 [Parabacteroides merdae ATCC 43184]